MADSLWQNHPGHAASFGGGGVPPAAAAALPETARDAAGAFFYLPHGLLGLAVRVEDEAAFVAAAQAAWARRRRWAAYGALGLCVAAAAGVATAWGLGSGGGLAGTLRLLAWPAAAAALATAALGAITRRAALRPLAGAARHSLDGVQVLQVLQSWLRAAERRRGARRRAAVCFLAPLVAAAAARQIAVGALAPRLAGLALLLWGVERLAAAVAALVAWRLPAAGVPAALRPLGGRGRLALWAPRGLWLAGAAARWAGGTLVLLALFGEPPPPPVLRERLDAAAQQAEMVWLDPGWAADLRLRVVRSLCRPGGDGDLVQVDLQLAAAPPAAASAEPAAAAPAAASAELAAAPPAAPAPTLAHIELAASLLVAAPRRDGDLVVTLPERPAHQEAVAVAVTGGAAPTAWRLRLPVAAGACGGAPVLLAIASPSPPAPARAPPPSLFVVLRPRPAAELDAAPPAMPWEGAPAAAAAGAPPPPAGAPALSILRRRGRGCVWLRQEPRGAAREVAFIERGCHRVAIGLGGGGRAVLSRGDGLELVALAGGATQSSVNPIDTREAATLAALDPQGTLMAHVLVRGQPPSSTLFVRADEGWQAIAGPAPPPASVWEALAHPMARRPGVALLHSGLRAAGEPWLHLAGDPASWDWRPLARAQVARLPAAGRRRAGAWGQRPGPPAATLVGGHGGAPAGPAAPGTAAARRPPTALVAWLEGGAQDPEAVSAPVVWLHEGGARVLVELPQYGAPPALRAAVRGNLALIGGRAVATADGPLEASVPFVRVDLRTGEVLETYDDEVADVQFWPATGTAAAPAGHRRHTPPRPAATRAGAAALGHQPGRP